MMRARHLGALALPMLGLVCIPSIGYGQVLEWSDLETDPVAAGWYTSVSQSADGNAWVADPLNPANHVLQVGRPAGLAASQLSYWQSPGARPATGEEYRKVSFSVLGPWPNPSNSRFVPTSTSDHWTQNATYVHVSGAEASNAYNVFFGASTPYYIDNVRTETATAQDLTNWRDGLYASMGAKVRLGTNNGQQGVARSIQTLRSAGSLNVVMLGDSIIADTAASDFDVLLERAYPGASVNVTPSVRGSTGCWYYKDTATVTDPSYGEIAGVPRVQTYVLDHNPDLVMIGGISQAGDIDSIRSVIQQIKAGSNAEILLLSPAVGGNNPYADPQWRFDVSATDTDYRGQLLALASEQHVGFLDMTGPWEQFVLDSGLPYSFFQRDVIHANQYGSEVLGRSLLAYLGPAAVPEPASLALLTLGAAVLLRRRR